MRKLIPLAPGNHRVRDLLRVEEHLVAPHGYSALGKLLLLLLLLLLMLLLLLLLEGDDVTLLNCLVHPLWCPQRVQGT